MSWSIRNYNAFLRQSKSSGLNYFERQQLYRDMRSYLGRSIYGKDAKTAREPSILATARENYVEYRATKLAEKQPAVYDFTRGVSSSQLTAISTSEDVWEDVQDIWDDWYDIDYEVSNSLYED